MRELQSSQLPESLRPFENRMRGKPDYARRMAKLCAIMKGKVDVQTLSRVCILVRELAPNDHIVLSLTGVVLNETVPGWHFACLDDVDRNLAYKTALNALIEPDTLVLDVGAGCGILSLFAAEAGANHVYAVEIEPIVAEKAREIIEVNGYSDRITVIEKDIREVELGVDIPERCNLLVQDIVWPNPFSRGIHDLLDYCRTNLMESDALFCPDSIKVKGALSGPDFKLGSPDYGNLFGFDLSSMNLLAPTSRNYPREHSPSNLLSDPFTIIHFDLTSPELISDVQKRVPVTTSHSGNLQHILRWLEFTFPDGTKLENDPTRSSCRSLMTSKIFQPRNVEPNETVALRLDIVDNRVELSLDQINGQ